jgi:hypothetical protein
MNQTPEHLLAPYKSALIAAARELLRASGTGGVAFEIPGATPPQVIVLGAAAEIGQLVDLPAREPMLGGRRKGDMRSPVPLKQRPAPAPIRISLIDAGADCMGEEDCRADGIRFGDYERGVADAIEACGNIVRKALAQQAEAAPAPSADPQIAVELQGVAHEIAEGSGFWRACSGCYETEDGHPVGSYPHSDVLGCTLGSGCSECGGIGAVWDNTDYEAMGRDWMREEVEAGSAAAPVGQAAPDLSDAEFLSKRLARVAKLTGAHIPEHFTHEQIAEVAGTILGDIARRLEVGQAEAAEPVAGNIIPEFMAALEKAYPLPVTPHTSVAMAAMDKREAFRRGWLARGLVAPVGRSTARCPTVSCALHDVLTGRALPAPTQATLDVLAERRRQVEAEGWTAAHDDQYVDNELAFAAASYATTHNADILPKTWPWPATWWKPTGNRRDLVKAGALILADIERLDRAAAHPQQGESNGQG